jgi:ABC-type dipeptide/oligopeptide/nickel transport system permease subunit
VSKAMLGRLGVFVRRYQLLVGAILTALVIVLCLFSFIYMPYDPNDMQLNLKFMGPWENSAHILGTDYFGRDILSRIIYGSRSILLVCVLAVTLGGMAGSLLGAVASIVKGPFSSVIMRTMDGLMAFPGILLAMMMVIAVGKGNTGAVIAISIFMVPSFARLAYSLILDSENLLFIKAARSYGINRLRLFIKHYLPLLLPRLITQFTSCIGAAIMIETSLSFLGLGVQPPNASWGLMLNEARQHFFQYPYLAVSPGIAIVLSILGFNLLGDGLNDLLIRRRS